MKSAVVAAASFVILFNILMISALYINSNQVQAQVQPSAKGVGEAFFTTGSTVTPSSVSTLAVASAGPDGPYLKVVNINMQSGAMTDPSLSVFSPNVVTLVVGVNNTVTFTNQDETGIHTVASYAVPAGATSFSSGALKLGASYSLTLGVRGTYYFGCTECPWMKGVIVVK